jgi:hypothetical protein
MSSIKSSLIVTAKFGLAGAVICAVAWVVTVYRPDGSVRSSQADILDLSFIELSNSARFARGLKHLGHDEPQTFSINDNIVNFSVNVSRKRPRQLVREYQREFVYQGLNEKVWGADSTFATDPEMFMEAMSGGVVPINVTDDFAVLGGVLTVTGAENARELEDLARSEDPEHDKIFSGHHVLQMHWNPRKLRTTVTATWSNEHFSYPKMMLANSTREEEPAVPPCPDCKVVSRIRDLDASTVYSNKIFSGDRSQRRLLNFYRRVMPKQGWTETEASVTFNLMRPYIEFQGDEVGMVQFARGNRFLTITGFPGEAGQTVVHTTISN